MFDVFTPSAEDMKKPYASLFKRVLPQPRSELMEIIISASQMPRSEALSPLEVSRMLEPGYLPGENGFCMFEDGTGYVAVLTPMPGVDFAMMKAWGDWLDGEDGDFRYKIWYPEKHATQNRYLALEDIGNGPEDVIFLNIFPPEHMGISSKELFDAATIVPGGRNGISKPCSSPVGAAFTPTAVCHFIRRTDVGVEMRSRFWIGWHCSDKGFFNALDKGQRVPENHAYNLFCHCAHEMASMADLIPLLSKNGFLHN